MDSVDAVIVGSGPNGLAAAVTLALAGRSVVVYEHGEQIGGGLRSDVLAEDGFIHDLCAAAHPLGVASPFFRSLTDQGHLPDRWRFGDVEFAHPLDEGRAGIATANLATTTAGLGEDAGRYTRLIGPVANSMDELLTDILDLPLTRMPHAPKALTTLGLRAPWPATWLHRLFRTEEARGLLAGCAAHAIMSLSRPATGAFAVLFAATAAARRWPVVAGGSGQLANDLGQIIETNGGRIETSRKITSLDELPRHKVAMFDTNPAQVAAIAGTKLSGKERRRFTDFRHGLAVFKLDYTLDGPIPWTNPDCARAVTVHVGGTAAEVVAAEGETANGGHPERPFAIAVQPTVADPSRAPEGKSILWIYCHVPAHSTVDMTDRIEAQLERFAPGFRDLVRTRTSTSPASLEQRNPNCVGGDIGGGAMTGTQLLLRPGPSRYPYDTSNPGVFICSASTPPGAGVHGMPGHNAAKRALATTLS